MNNELIIFENKNFGKVRTIIINNEPWFVGKDVAEKLGYLNPQRAIRAHVDEEDKGVNEMVTPGGTQQMVIINESGLYSLILSSKLPSAKTFKRWVTSEILPAIRKSGYYLGSQESTLSEIKNNGLLEEYSKLSEVERILKYFNLVKENESLKEDIKQKVKYIDDFVEQIKWCSGAIKNKIDGESTALTKGDNK